MPDEKHFARQRDAMVEQQIAARGVADARVLEVMGSLPRHRFVPSNLEARAYEDHAFEIGSGQTISQPYIVALMTELLDLTPGDRVLEVGTGTGYQTAVLARLAKEVVTIERIETLAQSAEERLADLKLTNVVYVLGDGTRGCPEHAPYDAIIVTAAGPCVPYSLESQLAMGGRLVCPVGDREVQQLMRRVRTPHGMDTETSIRCQFVPLIGEEGWEARPD